MAPYIFLVAAVLLFGAMLRIWLDFGQRSRHLSVEVQRLRKLTDDHAESLAEIRKRTKDVERETEILIRKREELHAKVLESRESLTQLEEKLERIKPKSHQVDNKKDSSGDDWI